MLEPEDVLNVFELRMKDLLNTATNSIFLYHNDNAIPFGKVMLDDNGKCKLRFGFSTHTTARTSFIKKNQNGISIIPTNYNQKGLDY